MTRPLRLALLGYGFIGKLHEQAALACGLEIARVCRRDDDWSEAVRAADVDAVVVGTPNALHHPQAMAALEVQVGLRMLMGILRSPMAVVAAMAVTEVPSEAMAAMVAMVATD